MTGHGWVVTGNLGVLVDTVSSHRRGAIVNYLYTYERWPMSSDLTDAQIEEIWSKRKVRAFRSSPCASSRPER